MSDDITMIEDSLGRCPACGGMEYTTIPMRWNVWECLLCASWSAFREGILELIPKADIRDMKTETDAMIEHLMTDTVKDWGTMNRNACNFIHRKDG